MTSRRGWIRSVSALAVLLAGCGGQAAKPTPTPAPQARLVVVGDSLTAGRYADTPAQAFPQLVAAATRSGLEVVGLPGATTAQIAAQPLPGDGKIVIVEAGTNDFINQTPRRQFAADYKAL